jgi:3-phenylpropionate/trans-cinnamate dioxygenase ferredoxin subunit
VRVLLEPPMLPPAGGRKVLSLRGHSIALFEAGGSYRAIADSCPHQGASLAGGTVQDGAVQCPAHGLRFDLATGCLRNAPALRVAVYPIETGPDGVHLILPDQAC